MKFGPQETHLRGALSSTIKNLIIELKGPHQCAVNLINKKIVIRKVLEYEVNFDSKAGPVKADMHVSNKYIYLKSTYPLKGIRTCVCNDGSFIKKIKMRFLSDPGVVFTSQGEQALLFLLNDIINTTTLAISDPYKIAGYYSQARLSLTEINPELAVKKISSSTHGCIQAGNWISDTVRKNHYFSFTGINMLLSFQAIMINHPEIFNPGLN